MAISDYRFSRPPSEEDLEMTATQRLIESGRPPSKYKSMDEWKAAVRSEASAIKESRDPKREKKRQLEERGASKSKADEILKKEGLDPQEFWASEPGLTKKSFTERTGKKVALPKESRTEAVSRMVETPEGGAVRQIAGAYGYGSTKLSPEGKAKFEAAKEKEQALAAMRERGGILRMEREKREGAASTAKRQQWESDKQAYAEGVQLQRDANKQLAQIRKAEINRGRAVRAGLAAPYTPEEFIARQDEKAALQRIINAREGMGTEKSKKEITEAGYDADARRRNLAAEQARLKRSDQQRSVAFDIEAESKRNLAKYYDPVSSATDEFWRTHFPNFESGDFVPLTYSY